MESFQKGDLHMKLSKQILSFKSGPPLRRETKKAELLPLKVYPFILWWLITIN